MLINNIILTFRNFKRHKLHSIVNVSGFSIGMASCMVIMLYVLFELSYDRFHNQSDRIYRVSVIFQHYGSELLKGPITPAPLAKVLKDDFPEVEESTRLCDISNIPVRYKDKNFIEKDFLYVDANFFDVFKFNLISGDPAKTFLEKHKLFLTQKTARKYFGDEPPLGKFMEMGKELYEVAGIIENPPANSHIYFDALVSMVSLPESQETSWFGGGNFFTYLRLNDKKSAPNLEAKFPSLIAKHVGPTISQMTGAPWADYLQQGNRWEYFLQPLTDIHLHSNFYAELQPNGNYQNIYIFSVLAGIILLIACINYINLSTARSIIRAKEVSIKKIIGAPKNSLVWQFLTESTIYCLISIVGALYLTILFINILNSIFQTNLSFHIIWKWWLPLFILICVPIISLITGLFPTLYLITFKPVEVMKGKIGTGSKSKNTRRNFVTLQFAILIGLIIFALFIHNQIEYGQRKKLGFDRQDIIVLPNVGKNLAGQLKPFKQTLMEQSRVESCSYTISLPANESGLVSTIEIDESAEKHLAMTIFTDHDYNKTLKMDMLEGRDFRQDPNFDLTSCIVNEAAVRKFNLKNPIGKHVIADDTKYEIIGVVRDFNIMSFKKKIMPSVLLIGDKQIFHELETFLLIRLKTDNTKNALNMIAEKWKSFTSNTPFEYSFLDDDYNAMFNAEQRLKTVVITFTILALIVACLGLFSLVTFVVEQRTKEIGIRKVLGASVFSITRLLTQEFMKWIILANIIAWPIAYYAMTKWLQNFSYRTNMTIGPFILAGVITLVIALFTVSSQAVRAATANPVETLRYE